MLRIGITGGIGSGKSTVARIFETLGIPVYYADDAAKKLMNSDVLLREKIINAFGEASYKEGKLDRQFLSSLVFNNPEKLNLLNSIVHPATIEDASNWMLLQTSPYSIKEAALIFESGAQKSLDYVIGVAAPEPIRILRTMNRDHISKEDVIARMHRQMEESIKMKLCDFVINNNEQVLLIPQVIELHEKLIEMSNV